MFRRNHLILCTLLMALYLASFCTGCNPDKAIQFPARGGEWQPAGGLEFGICGFGIAGAPVLTDPIKKKSDSWMYLPTMRRVRRTPTMRDGFQTEGEYTMDDLQEFMGDVTLWDWKLLGKKEMYVSDNNYDLFLPDSDGKDEVMAGHVNPERIRYGSQKRAGGRQSKPFR